MAGRTLVGLGVMFAAVALFLGPFVWAAVPTNIRETEVTGQAQVQLNGRLVLMCAGSRQDLLYIYQNLKGEPVGIAVVPRGCRED